LGECKSIQIEIQSHPCQNGYHQEKTINAGQDAGEKETPIPTASGNG
jgi:hypothetical protein